eukprot:scaffold259_cov252-Pinguiococcus_pyrenoidosus.AAC.14
MQNGVVAHLDAEPPCTRAVELAPHVRAVVEHDLLAEQGAQPLAPKLLCRVASAGHDGTDRLEGDRPRLAVLVAHVPEQPFEDGLLVPPDDDRNAPAERESQLRSFALRLGEVVAQRLAQGDAQRVRHAFQRVRSHTCPEQLQQLQADLLGALHKGRDAHSLREDLDHLAEHMSLQVVDGVLLKILSRAAKEGQQNLARQVPASLRLIGQRLRERIGQHEKLRKRGREGRVPRRLVQHAADVLERATANAAIRVSKTTEVALKPLGPLFLGGTHRVAVMNRGGAEQLETI